ncbi:MAG TPA: hypothetical protein VN310_18710 [Candidatus Dormibacteraeota bacterium]|nr:hypothetical protein [Candidatus Dormibacteraeota bacterium]
MNRILKSDMMMRNWAAVLLLMAVPVFAWGQKKNSPAPAPKSAPASHASAPAQHAPAQHSSAPSHSAGSTHSNSTAGHGSTTQGHGNTTTGHGSTTTAGHGNTTAGHGSATTAGHGNTTAGHGSTTTAGHGNTTAGHGATAGGHANTASHANTAHTPPGKSVSLKGGGSAHIRPNGQIRSVNKNGMHIEHGMHGGRKVVSTHNGVRVVSNGRGRGGYTQRAYVTRGGRSYYSRTYYYNGGYRSGVYVGYNYGGYPYYGYNPGYYYGPAYYGWAYNPWPAPVAYGWGWGGAPWYGYYGAYYQPYPVYPSAAFWLTDYLIAASLQAAYTANAEANEGWLLRPDASQGTLVASLLAVPAPAETAKLSPEVKKDLAEEVKIALAAEQADAGKAKGSSGGAAPANKNEAPPALDPKFKTFVVSADLSLVADGAECALSDGDVVVRTTDTPDDDQNVNVKVVASTKSDCAIGKEGPLGVDDLQEMYNHFREGLKDGMGELAKKQGTGGLPKSPDTKTTAGDVPPPEPDKSAEKALKDQAAAADQTEAEVKQEAGSGGGQ